jgi:uncharacterized protein with ParB-like and HNH nuclease domain
VSTITPNYRNVKQLLASASFSIDEYQREYKWGHKQIAELMDDLTAKFLSCYRENDETKAVAGYEDYFLGSIIISKRGTKSYLVDGQQRVSSLTLLLIHLYRKALELQLDVANEIAPLIFSNSFGEKKFNLDIPEREPVIRALFEGKEFNPDGHDESIQTMFDRFSEISERDLSGELGGALPHFIYWLMAKVGLIEISTDNDAYAYAIFETMNDRGKPLSPVDMLKAYLLGPVDDAEKRRLVNQNWKKEIFDLISWGGESAPERDAACIKAWLRAQHATSIRERKAGSTDRDWELIGQPFHRWVRDNTQQLGLGKPQANINFMAIEFPFFAHAYTKVLDASRTYKPGWEAIFYNAHNEFTWQNTVLLAPLVTTDDDETVRRKIVATATYLDIWLMRRAANYVRIGYSSTAYAMFLLCRDVRQKPLKELVQILSDKLTKDEMDFDGAPSKGRLGISDLGLNQFSRRYIFHMLARITAYTEVGSGKPDLFSIYVNRQVKNAFDIEHIWANDFESFGGQVSDRSEFASYRDHIAGLLLLPADVNRSLQDKPFEEKAQVYGGQNLYAASLYEGAYKNQPQFLAFQAREQLKFTPPTKFGKVEQIERRGLVLSLVKKIWSPERLQTVLE